MGLTLPVIMEDRQLASAHFGRAIGILYGFNTLGAVAGALIGELFLVKAFGLWGTSLAAGLLNCIAATIALVLATEHSDSSVSHPPPARLPSRRGERIKVRGGSDAERVGR